MITDAATCVMNGERLAGMGVHTDRIISQACRTRLPIHGIPIGAAPYIPAHTSPGDPAVAAGGRGGVRLHSGGRGVGP